MIYFDNLICSYKTPMDTYLSEVLFGMLTVNLSISRNNSHKDKSFFRADRWH